MTKFGVEQTGLSSPSLQGASFISQGVQDNSKAIRTQATTGLIKNVGEMGIEAYKGYQLADIEAEEEKEIQNYIDRRDPEKLKIESSILETQRASMLLQGVPEEEVNPVTKRFQETVSRYENAVKQGIMSPEDFTDRTLSVLRTAANRNPGLLKELSDHADKVLGMSGITTIVKEDKEYRDAQIKTQEKVQTELRSFADANNIKYNAFNPDYLDIQKQKQIIQEEKGVLEAFRRETDVTEEKARRFGPTLANGLINEARNMSIAIMNDPNIPLDKALYQVRNIFLSVDRGFSNDPKIGAVIDKPSVAATRSMIKNQTDIEIANIEKYSTKEDLKNYLENSTSISRNQDITTLRNQGVSQTQVELISKLSASPAFAAMMSKDGSGAIKIYNQAARALEGLGSFIPNTISMYDKNSAIGKSFAIESFNQLAIDAGKENGENSVSGLSNFISAIDTDLNKMDQAQKFEFQDDYIKTLGNPSNKEGISKLDDVSIGKATKTLDTYTKTVSKDFIKRVTELKAEGKTIVLSVNPADGRMTLGTETSPEVIDELNGKYIKRINNSLTAYTSLSNAPSSSTVAPYFYKNFLGIGNTSTSTKNEEGPLDKKVEELLIKSKKEGASNETIAKWWRRPIEEVEAFFKRKEDEIKKSMRENTSKYDKRFNSEENKGNGWLGELKVPGTDAIATEYSIGVNIGGKEIQIPTIVPTLTKEEKDQLLQDISKNKMPSKSIVDKAVEHAKKRLAEGKSPFKD